MKTEQKTAPAALRRGMAFLCTLVLTLMAVTLPAEAALTNSLTDKSNIGLTEGASNKGEQSYQLLGNDDTLGMKISWDAKSTTITGSVAPTEQKSYKAWYPGVSESGWGKTCYKSASSTLIITNTSGKSCILSFSYTTDAMNGGTLTFAPAPAGGANNGTYTATLKPKDTVKVTLTTAKETRWHKDSCQKIYTATTRLSNIQLKPLDENVSVTLKPAANGSYTAKAGDTPLAVGKAHQYPAKTEYTFTKDTADPNYVFDGWYINGKFASGESPFTTTFASDSTVEACFKPDPLLSLIQLGEGATENTTDYVAVNSDYHHSSKRSWHRETVPNVENGCKNVSFPDPRWSVEGNGIVSSATGTAQGDWQIGAGRSQALANLYSDVIRIQCKKSCTISFTGTMRADPATTAAFSNENLDNFGGFLYYYTSKNPNETRQSEFIKGTAVISGAKKNGVTQNASVTVNKGEYLYLYAYGRTLDEEFYLVANGKYPESTYSYRAAISNVTVTPVDKEYTFTTANEDNTNTNAILKSGTVIVNNVRESVASGAYTATLAGGTVITLKPDTAPTGYTFIGWHNVTDKTYDYTHDTYTVTLTKDYTVNPIYVPAMTITTGGTNGFENATYKYKDLSGNTATPTGQYVARNADCSKFYTNLNDAFSDTSTNTVFLLAGDTINGNLTIPAGKTLVIPDRFADPGPDANQPEQYDSTAGISNSSYCKVSYNGDLTVNGKLVVNARQSGTADGRATGGIGYLSLSNDATITVNNGGQLCGYGLIRGGAITAKSGSTVRELMEISDRRSEQATKEIYTNKSKKTFLFNHFSVKTIESRATYEYGAKLLAQYSITLEGNNKSAGSVRLFATTDALFNLTKGSMTKYFDRAADKTVYHLDKDGEMSTGKFSIALSILGQSANIDTSDYWVPLNAGFDLRTAGDMTIKSDFKFLPGASLSVEKGGKCIIDRNANLLFYRLNDYDTRSPDSKSPYYRGYSSKGYPYKATDLPEGEYNHPKLAAVGSARLNVDGEMIVNGGLYVSNDLIRDSDQGIKDPVTVNGTAKPRKEINAADFTAPYPYDNGYNVLTGTGTVTMNNVLSDSEVYEVMAAYGTVDIQWATVKITPIAGLKADAETDDPKNYNAFNQKTTYYGVYHLGNFYTWTDEMPQIAKIVGGNNDGTIYRSLADAVAAYDGTNGYIQMLDKSTEPGFTVDRNVTLDLNGKTVTLAGTLTVAEGYTLSGMDSSTGTGYDTLPTGKIVGKVTGTVAPTYETPPVKVGDVDTYDRYVAIPGTENGTSTLSFHHFNISVTGYRFELAAPKCALIFRGEFRGDDEAKKHLKSLGFTLTDKDGKSLGTDSSPITDPKDIPKESEPGESKVVLAEDGAFLFEFYLIRSFEKNPTDDTAYTEEFSATAHATFDNGGTQDSGTKDRKTQHLSFQKAWQDSSKTAKDKEILQKFLDEFGIKIQVE